MSSAGRKGRVSGPSRTDERARGSKQRAEGLGSDDGDGDKEKDVRKMVERVKARPESTTLVSFRFVVGDKFQTVLVTTEGNLWKEV